MGGFHPGNRLKGRSRDTPEEHSTITLSDGTQNSEQAWRKNWARTNIRQRVHRQGKLWQNSESLKTSLTMKPSLYSKQKQPCVLYSFVTQVKLYVAEFWGRVLFLYPGIWLQWNGRIFFMLDSLVAGAKPCIESPLGPPLTHNAVVHWALSQSLVLSIQVTSQTVLHLGATGMYH